MKRAARLVGRCQDGHDVIEARNADGSTEVLHARPLASGEPVPLGTKAIHQAQREADGSLSLTTTKIGHAGPARVTSEAYRTNHHAVFGPTQRERDLMN